MHVKQARGACASFVLGFVTFMSIGGFPSFVEDMKVCYKGAAHILAKMFIFLK